MGMPGDQENYSGDRHAEQNTRDYTDHDDVQEILDYSIARAIHLYLHLVN
jgi:hypothetical protein